MIFFDKHVILKKKAKNILNFMKFYAPVSVNIVSQELPFYFYIKNQLVHDSHQQIPALSLPRITTPCYFARNYSKIYYDEMIIVNSLV